ncbi:MAG: TetR/AcrR family transcriptional regulator [Alistipes sp.]|jgi:AcrR family transcriptional regulator|nr:TetR/AcrR family transcriptional regulator [Alistipes sp.]
MTQREVIIENAMRMFVTHGVKAVRMDDIARELSVSKRTLYELFGDKEELLYQSVKLYSEQLHYQRQQLMRSAENELEMMIICLRDMINVAPVSSRMRRNIKRFYPEVYVRLETEFTSLMRESISRWVNVCVQKGYFTTTAECDLIINILYGSSQGLLTSELFESRQPTEVISMLSYSLVVFIRGLCTPKGIEIIDKSFSKYLGNI